MGDKIKAVVTEVEKPQVKKELNVFLAVMIFIVVVLIGFFIFQENLKSFEKSLAIGDMQTIDSLPVFESMNLSNSLVEEEKVIRSSSSSSYVFLSEDRALIYYTGYLSEDGENWEEVNFSGDNYTNWIAEDISFNLTKNHEYIAFFSCKRKFFSWDCPSKWNVVRMNKSEIDPLIDYKVDERKRQREELVDRYKNKLELDLLNDSVNDEVVSSSGGGGVGSSGGSGSSDSSSEDEDEEVVVDNDTGINESFFGPYFVDTVYGLVNVTASDYDVSYNATPDKVLDNNITVPSRWSSSGEQWIKFSFDEVKELDGVNIMFYRGDIRRANFSVDVSLNGSTWQNVFSGESSGNISGFEKFSFTPVNLTGLRLFGYGNNDSEWNSIIEMNFSLNVDCLDNETRTVSCDSSDPNSLISERTQSCQDGSWLNESCEIVSCVSGYILESGSCVLQEVNYTDLLCETGYYENGSECESLAFPTAMGYGRYTTGGRGGQVVHVTSLDGNSYSEGTIRYALEYITDPRIVVFDVGGEIEIDDPIEIKDGSVTIAGQTAPGEGITIRGHGFNIEDGNVIMRHIRIRPGDDYVYSVAPDAINIIGHTSGHDISDIILDHTSLSWGLDEVFSIWPRDAVQGNVTLQNSIISEGLQYSTHDEGGSHSRGILIGTYSSEVSILNNLFAHNRRRNPLINPDTANIDFLNNVVYNWGKYKIGAAMHTYLSVTGVNIIGNYYKSGPNSVHGPSGCNPPFEYGVDDCNEPLYGRGSYFGSASTPSDLTVIDNVYDDGSSVEDARVASYCFNDVSCSAEYNEAPNFDMRDVPLRSPEGFVLKNATATYDYVLANAGNTIPYRDAADERVLDSVVSEGGQIIDSPEALPARALPFAVYGWSFFTGLGDMSSGYDWSSATESFTVNGYTVNLDQDCTNQGSSDANLQCILDMINNDLPADIVAYNPTSYTNMYRVGIRTSGLGSSESLVVSGNAVYDRFWMSEGIYYGFDGVNNTDGSIGYPPIASGSAAADSDGDGMPDYWENRHCLDSVVDDSAMYNLSAIYTNVEVYLNDLAGDFGAELESQC